MVADYKVTPCRNPAITARLLFYKQCIFNPLYFPGDVRKE